MATKKDLLALAQSELGYLEKSKANWNKYGKECLYPKTQYAGQDNVQKYSYEVGHYDYCGWAPWCQSFIGWLFLKTFGKELANKLLCGMLGSASTMDVKNAFVKNGRQVLLSAAQAGDIVYRSRSGGGHVGLVVGTQNGKIVTIEGNSSSSDITSWNGGAVVKHVGASWSWCCRPDWSLTEPNVETWHWVQSGDKWYYQNSKGQNKHGWAKIRETGGNYYHWYWFNTRGVMQTGDKQIDGKWYFFQPDGTLEGALCDTDDSGALKVWSLTE